MKKLQIEYLEILETLLDFEKENKAIKDITLRGIRNLFEHDEEKIVVNQ